MLRKLLIVPLISCATALVAAGAAQATTFCVNHSGEDCDLDRPSIGAALTDATANAGVDTVLIGPGTYDEGGPLTYSVASAANAVEIVGVGNPRPVIAPSSLSQLQAALHVAGPESSVTGLRIEIPDFESVRGLTVGIGASAEQIEITSETTKFVTGAQVNGDASLSDTTIELSRNHSNVAVSTGSGASVQDVTTHSRTGISHSGGAVQIDRATVRSNFVGAVVDSGQIAISNSVLDIGTAANAAGLAARNNNPGTSAKSIVADHVTIVGGSGSNSIGALAHSTAANAAQTSTLELSNSIIEGPEFALSCRAENNGSPGADSTAQVDTRFSNYDAASVDVRDENTQPADFPNGVCTVNHSDDLDTTPGFVDEAVGDLRLRADSPLIDAGDPTPGGPAQDILGATRVFDGDGDGVARRDPGAYELVDTAGPELDVTGPSGPTADATPTFEFSADEPVANVECRVDGAPFGPCSGPGNSHTAGPLADGPHEFAVTATDELGNVGQAEVQFDVDTTDPTVEIATGPAELSNDATPAWTFSVSPDATKLECRIDGAAFTPCAGATSHTATVADGRHMLEVRATDAAGNSAAATDEFAVDTVAPDTALTKKPRKRSTKRKARFAFSAADAAGFECKLDRANFAPCSSPLVTKRLRRGRHTFAVRAVDAAGNADPTPASYRFKIRRKRRG